MSNDNKNSFINSSVNNNKATSHNCVFHLRLLFLSYDYRAQYIFFITNIYLDSSTFDISALILTNPSFHTTNVPPVIADNNVFFVNTFVLLKNPHAILAKCSYIN